MKDAKFASAPSARPLAIPKWNPFWLKRRFYAQRFLNLLYRGEIPAGSFRGMRYVRRWWQRLPNPAAMAGTYELELWPAIEDAIARRPGLIVDVGSHEGYYTAGFAFRCPETRIVGFEKNGAIGDRRDELESLNGLKGRILHRGAFCHADLENLLRLGLRTLLWVDVDGAEAEVLDLWKIPQLAQTEILVEVHDHRRPGVSSELHGRFDGSHHIEVIPSRARVPADLPPHPRWFEGRMLKLADERSLAHQWFWMRPRSD